MKFKDYLCSYWHDRAEWSLIIPARDWDDAQARCKKLGLRLDGEVQAVIPAKVGWIAKLAQPTNLTDQSAAGFSAAPTLQASPTTGENASK